VNEEKEYQLRTVRMHPSEFLRHADADIRRDMPEYPDLANSQVSPYAMTLPKLTSGSGTGVRADVAWERV